MSNFETEYAKLEGRFRDQVRVDRTSYDSNDIVFLPSFPKPKSKVDCVIVGMEPSLTDLWAGTPPNVRDAEAKVKDGFCDFLPFRFDDAIVRYAAREFCGEGYCAYYMTNISKGAMKPDCADKTRSQRWIDWFPLLRDEVELVACSDAKVYALGGKVYNFLRRKRLETGNGTNYHPREWVQSRFRGGLFLLMHHSPRTNAARIRMAKVNEAAYQEALSGVTEQTLVQFAAEILESGGATRSMVDWCLGELRRRPLSEAQRALLYCYRLQFRGI